MTKKNCIQGLLIECFKEIKKCNGYEFFMGTEIGENFPCISKKKFNEFSLFMKILAYIGGMKNWV